MRWWAPEWYFGIFSLAAFLLLSSLPRLLPILLPLPLPPTSALSIHGSLENDTDVSVKSYAFNSSRYDFKNVFQQYVLAV